MIDLSNNDEQLKHLHEKLWKHIENQNNNWKGLIYAKEKGFYQGFAEIGIDGWRPTEKRFKDYDIEPYLSKMKSTLDIGCNCGFFSLYTSKFVKEIDGIDINPYLISIANDTKEFLNVRNANFYNYSFENFPIKTYDIIFSLANDSTIDMNTKFHFREYIAKILKILSKNGILIFESQAEDAIDKENKFNPKFEVLKKYFKVREEKLVNSEYPVNVPQRIFLILQKRV